MPQDVIINKSGAGLLFTHHAHARYSGVDVFTTRSVITTAIIITLMSSATSAGTDRQLAACPQTPNCVSSQAANGRNAIAPFAFDEPAATAWDRLKSVVQSQARTVIVDETANYLHAETRSRLFGFVDDVEFLLLPDDNIIHVRSASRTGYSDFGVNRRRVERLRRAFTEH